MCEGVKNYMLKYIWYINKKKMKSYYDLLLLIKQFNQYEY